MELMFDSNPVASSPDILFFQSGEPINAAASEKLNKSQYSMGHLDWDGFAIDGLSEGVKVVIASLQSDALESRLKILKEIQKKLINVSFLLIHDGLSSAEIEKIINEIEVFAITGRGENLIPFLKKAIEDHDDKKKFNLALTQVKQQNQKFESLNKNLEELVYERTKKEFAASQQTARSLKTLQSILNFIKEVARSESIESVMVKIRDDFKKTDAFLPPLLILKTHNNLVRLFFFQGKQLIEKRITDSLSIESFIDHSDHKFRASLSNSLGRPIGPLSIHPLEFHSQELSQAEAIIVFENSLGEAKRKIPLDDSKERWPIVAITLENILLKEGMQNIARQWAKTFNNMKDPILIINDEYQMTLSNSEFHKGQEKNCFRSFAAKEEICKGCPLEKTMTSGEPVTSDIHVDKKVYRVHSYPIKLEKDSSAFHVINQYVDVTQTIDLQSRVIQGEKMAAVGLLAGNIAHELNNPLTGIHSLTELLLEDFEKESNTYNDMVEIRNAAKRCQRIIKDLLEFSSVDDPKKSKEFNINSIIKKTLPLLKMAMRNLGSHINLVEEPHRCWI